MKTADVLELHGLQAAPSQVCGHFRLVPLLREKPCHDVRLGLETYQQDLTRVRLDDRTEYWAFVPHGLVLHWAKGHEATVSMGGQLKRHVPGKKLGDWLTLQTHHRMVKKQSNHSVRLLPLHLSMEAFLGLHFGGPNIAWPEYSRFAKSHGLGMRAERAVSGKSLFQFEDALRTFEIHAGQVGVLILVGEQLASAFVVPSPEDYRLLHHSLLEDFYGELVYRYALWYTSQDLRSPLPLQGAKTLSDLRQALQKGREEWAEFSTRLMGNDLLGRTILKEAIYKPAALRLERFITDLDLSTTNTIGERLVRQDGEVLYLKTFLLDSDQTKRAWWLSQLSRHNWHVQQTADALGLPYPEVIRGLDRAGFAHLLNPQVLFHARKPGRGK